MRIFSFATCAGTVAVALMCVACGSGPTDASALRGPWGSDQAVLASQDGTTTLHVNAGGCYGSYGEIDQAISSVHFTLPGSYTQLIGAYPGQVQYAAQFIGIVQGREMQLTVHVPSLQRDIGPLTLVYGVDQSWSACRYP